MHFLQMIFIATIFKSVNGMWVYERPRQHTFLPCFIVKKKKTQEEQTQK